MIGVKAVKGAAGISRWKSIVEARRAQNTAAGVDRAGSAGARQDNYARRLNDIVQASALQSNPPGLLMDMLRAKVRPDVTVLDVGPGPGRYTVSLARLVRQVIAVEPSVVMAGYLRDNLATAGLANVVVIDNPWLEAQVPRCNITLCSHVLYDVLEIEAFLRKLDASTDDTCFVVLHTHQFDFFGEALWPAIHGTPVAPMPLFSDLLALLPEVGIRPTGQAIMPPIARHTYDGLDDALEYALERLGWEDTAAHRLKLAPLVVGLLTPDEGKLLAPQSPPAGIVWWSKDSRPG
jgi:SAM-dependent methyltransferase